MIIKAVYSNSHKNRKWLKRPELRRSMRTSRTEIIRLILPQFGSHSRIYERQKRANRHHHHHHHRHHHHGSHHGGHHSRRHSAAGVMFRRDILYAGSLQNIPEYK